LVQVQVPLNLMYLSEDLTCMTPWPPRDQVSGSGS
jgi:hypothetical protein